MKVLGIDYGRVRMGIAVSQGFLADPLLVLPAKNKKILLEKISSLIKDYGIEEIVVGISESQMAKETENFIAELKRFVDIPIKTWDETLTTLEAEKITIGLGLGRTKRRKLQDAFAATIMLQSYLDTARV